LNYDAPNIERNRHWIDAVWIDVRLGVLQGQSPQNYRADYKRHRLLSDMKMVSAACK
jgi:hypothetical protein